MEITERACLERFSLIVYEGNVLHKCWESFFIRIAAWEFAAHSLTVVESVYNLNNKKFKRE